MPSDLLDHCYLKNDRLIPPQPPKNFNQAVGEAKNDRDREVEDVLWIAEEKFSGLRDLGEQVPSDYNDKPVQPAKMDSGSSIDVTL